MAKISARGDRERFRETTSKRTFVFTEQGRFLVKLNGLGTYRLLGRCSEETARDYIKRISAAEEALAS